MSSTNDNSDVPPLAVGGNRLEWTDIPLHVQHDITRLAGAPVISWSSQPGGFSPGLASRLELEDGRRIFVKAISADQNDEGPEISRREALISKALPLSALVPRLLWTHDDGTWVVLAFEDVEGRHPAQPWKEDELARVFDALGSLAQALTPSPLVVDTIVESNADALSYWRTWSAKAPDVDLDEIDPWILPSIELLARLETRWEAAATGETLLHGDLRADNILLTETGVVFVDWPGAQIGAAWVDALLMLPSMAMHGTDVQRIVDQHPIFSAVEAAEIDAVLAAASGYFIGRSTEPAPQGLPMVRVFQRAQGIAALHWLRKRIEAIHVL